MRTTNGGPARLLRVYGLWILLVTAVVMGVGYGVSMLAPTSYRSAAIVVVEARVQPNTTPVQPEMGTEKALAGSGLVVGPAARQIGVDPGALADGLTVSVAPDANVLTFAYDAADPVTAQRRAQALAQAYVDYRNAGDPPTSKDATAAGANARATLVTAAFLPVTPVARPIWIDLGIAAVLGLLLGVGTALLRDRMNDRIRGLADFEHITGVTALATVPRVRRRRGPGAARPIVLAAPQSSAAESYRYLRSRLQPLLGDGGATVLVASPSHGEGRSTTAANLAIALALAGRAVVLVDADLRHPRLHTMFDRAHELGLTTLLRGESTMAQTLQDGPVSRLRLLAAGPGAQADGDLLDGPALARVLRTLRQHSDVVVLDSAPVLSVADAIVLAAHSDHVLLVGDYRRTTRAALTRALTELREVVRANVSGVLVNAPRSAGGLVPRPRRADRVGPPVQVQVRAASQSPDRNGTDQRGADDWFAPPSAPAGAPSVYRATASVPPVIPGGERPTAAQPDSPAAEPAPAPAGPQTTARTPGPGGPVKARANGVDDRPNGFSVPTPRVAESSLEWPN